MMSTTHGSGSVSPHDAIHPLLAAPRQLPGEFRRMNRLVATAAVTLVLAGCAGSASSGSGGVGTPSSSPVATPVATSDAASVQPSSTASAVASAQPSAATTAFPVEAFATLTERPLRPDLASKLQAAL